MADGVGPYGPRLLHSQVDAIILKIMLLQAFEKDLFVHARIENEVLFPKALNLEAKVAKAVAESLKTY